MPPLLYTIIILIYFNQQRTNFNHKMRNHNHRRHSEPVWQHVQYMLSHSTPYSESDESLWGYNSLIFFLKTCQIFFFVPLHHPLLYYLMGKTSYCLFQSFLKHFCQPWGVWKRVMKNSIKLFWINTYFWSAFREQIRPRIGFWLNIVTPIRLRSRKTVTV